MCNLLYRISSTSVMKYGISDTLGIVCTYTETVQLLSRALTSSYDALTFDTPYCVAAACLAVTAMSELTTNIPFFHRFI